jgi:hypothetical protein
MTKATKAWKGNSHPAVNSVASCGTWNEAQDIAQEVNKG